MKKFFTGEKKYNCPVCGNVAYEKRGYFEICDACGWEDDELWQKGDYDNPITSRGMSVNQAREMWKRDGKVVYTLNGHQIIYPKTNQ